MAMDYPEMISVESIGQSWEKRDINLVKIDALDFMSKYVSQRKQLMVKNNLSEKELQNSNESKDKPSDDSFVQTS